MSLLLTLSTFSAIDFMKVYAYVRHLYFLSIYKKVCIHENNTNQFLR